MYVYIYADMEPAAKEGLVDIAAVFVCVCVNLLIRASKQAALYSM